MIRHLLSLGGISLVCALLLVGVQTLTSPVIERNRTAHSWQVAFELTGQPFDPSGLTWRNNSIRLPSGTRLRRSSVAGYAGEIHLLAAFSRAGKLLGGRVTRHQETPGLGDFIDLDKGPWMLQFSATSPSAVDAMSGATITSEAIKRGMRQMVERAAAR